MARQRRCVWRFAARRLPKPSRSRRPATLEPATAKPHGFCEHSCRYGCVNDAECASGEICLCGDLIGRCVEATCTVDGDCGEGFVCQRYDGLTDGGRALCDIERFACQTADDSCGSDVDCGERTFCNADSGRFEALNASVLHLIVRALVGHFGYWALLVPPHSRRTLRGRRRLFCSMPPSTRPSFEPWPRRPGLASV